MNIYRCTFWSICPADGDHIMYWLEIRSKSMVRVEEINAALEAEKSAFHEDIADRMFEQFGGEQCIMAIHQGVSVETRRGFK